MNDDKPTNNEELITHNSENPPDGEVRGTRYEVHGECGQCEEYLNGWKRAQADYANLKRESEIARIKTMDLANEHVLYELLPAIDQFAMALNYLPDVSKLPDAERRQLESWFMGITAVGQHWQQAFKALGLESVDTQGLFDPQKHNAVSQEEDVIQEPGTILRVIQPGWMLNGKVLRPAKVIVNSRKTDIDS